MAFVSNMTVVQNQQVQNLPRVGRKARRPQYTFNIECRPYGIYPFMIAPVLAGDTMENMMCQARVLTDPLDDHPSARLIGWWSEKYWFYVKLSDLDDRDTIIAALLNPGSNMTTIDSETGVAVHNFYAATGVPYVNWVEKCLKRVTEEYFRDEGETWNTETVETGIPKAQYQPPGLWRSATPFASASMDFMDVDVSTAGDNAFTITELQRAYDEYELLKAGGMVSITWDDYLALQGVKVPESEKHEDHKPELLRFSREWAYPISAIDPTDGSAASAVQWGEMIRADKARAFREPGFVFGVAVVRPKVYVRYVGTAAQLLTNAYAWLPRMLQRAYDEYELLKAGGMVSITWDDYLALQGVKVPESEKHEDHKPELLRFSREWAYPISAIDPTDGSAASAVQWGEMIRADKARAFREPGFVFGVAVVRPKVYVRYVGTAAQLLTNAYAWLPRMLDERPETSLLNIADQTFGGVNWADAGGVWVDLKDALLYGDQFHNYASNANIPNQVAANVTTDSLKYASTAEIDALFAAAAPDRTNARVRHDGICTLNIQSRVPIATDTSRGVMSSQPV